jgi:hypothetical protein
MSALAHPPLAERSNSLEPATGRVGSFSGLVWLTWRQHRWTLLGSLILTAVLVGWMAYLSIDLTNLHHQCHTRCSDYSAQDAALSGPFGLMRQVEWAGLAVRYAPLLAGVFIGVPMLAREHEQRTLLLAWSQDISPVRWLWTKLGLLGLYVAALTAMLSAVSDHLAHVYSTIRGGGLFTDPIFQVTGMLPLASSICWFTVGVALGAVFRRTLPAMFASIAGFIGLMLAVQWRYPTLMTPISVYSAFGPPAANDVFDRAGDHNTLIVGGGPHIDPGRVSGLFDSSGHEVTYADLRRMCPSLDLARTAMDSCFASNHLLSYSAYQPSSRIPVFHLIVAGGYLSLAALALVAVWLIVRRTNLSAG